VKQITF